MALEVPPISSRSEDDDPIDPKEQKETSDLWSRFVSAVWDSLAKYSGRDIQSLRSICLSLWPSFTSLIRDGTYTRKDFTRLLVAKRSAFQDENALVPNIASGQPKVKTKDTKFGASITTQLPITPRLLLIAAYLASYIPARLDRSLFSKASTFAKKRRRKTGPSTASQSNNITSKTGVKTKHRKIPRTLLGPQAFVLERLLAIFAAIKLEANVGKRYLAGGQTADVFMAIATLASLRLLIKSGGAADSLDAGVKYRVNVSWDVVRGVARSVGVEIEDFIVE
jgi:origin recognition complex subunit 5